MTTFTKVNLTTATGVPVDDNQNVLTAGRDGPVLMQDIHYFDKITHFDRERIPERVVHAKGSGAHGYFEVTQDISKYCKAAIFSKVGKRTPAFVRFSTVIGEKGSADTRRDPRGFAMKYYTEDGNLDLVCNNTPIFFIRDPIKFPDFVHALKKHPQKQWHDYNTFWDFISLTPESIHQITMLFSDRGTPDGFRHMHGFGGHTFKLVNAEGEGIWAKFHFMSESGVKNLTDEEAKRLEGDDPDYARRDLFEFIEKGGTPSWKLYVQLMPLEEAATYRFNIFDITKVWPHGDYPLHEVGRLVLNRNPTNFFAEVEQAAFSPSNLVPGIEASPDKMLQGRLISYSDTQRHRLGPNFMQIPINCPYASKLANHQRDGYMCVNGNGGSAANYQPNSEGGPVDAGSNYAIKSFLVEGEVRKFQPQLTDDDFYQANQLYSKVMKPDERERLHKNIVNHLKYARKDVQIRQVKLFMKVNKEYGTKVAEGLHLDVSSLT